MTIWSAEIKELERLYESFKGQHPKLEKELEKLVKTDDENMVLIYARRCLEVIITDLSERELKRPRGTEPLKGIIDKLNKEEKVPNNIIVSMQNLNSLSTFGAHPKDFDPMQVKPVILDLTTTLKWYLRYMEKQPVAEAEPGALGGKQKETAGGKKVPAKPKKRILLASAIVLVCAAIVVVLILTDVIKGGKGVKAGDIKSLVVLPLDNYTGIDTIEWVLSGIHNSLIQNMQRVSGWTIKGKTTAKAIKDANMAASDIASKLNVDALIEPALECYGDSICLNYSFLRIRPEEKILFTGVFKEEISQILNLYNCITKQVADKIMIDLTPEDERLLAKRRTVDRKTYDAFLMSHQYWDDFSQESLNKARDYLNSAVEKDPDWAPLYIGLAKVWMGLVQIGFESPPVGYQKVNENLSKSLELDPDLADSHHLIAMNAYLSEWNWPKAEREFLNALKINPNDAFTRIYYAHLLCILQRHDEALKQVQLAFDLDPLNPVIQVVSSAGLLCAGDCKAAIDSVEKVTAIDPENNGANQVLGLAAFRCGDYDKAFDAEKHVLYHFSRGQFDEDAFEEIERIFNEQGFFTAYEEILHQYEILDNKGIMNPIDMAISYIRGNHQDKAMDLIEKGYEIHDPSTPYIATKTFPFDSLYDNPRFIAILEKMDLPFAASN